MKEHGILFSAAMVRAILAGAKTTTRRLIKPQPDFLQIHTWKGETLYDCEHRVWGWKNHLFPDALVDCHGSNTLGEKLAPFAPHGPVGRRLWVRECWHQCPHCEGTVSYRAGGWTRGPTGAPDDGGDRCDDDARPLSPKCAAHGWKPSIHMPRWASRITLEVTRVRVERVQDISEDDAKAEGVNPRDAFIMFEATDAEMVRRRPDLERTHRGAYALLWDEINGAGSWAANPYVWVYDFRRVA